MKTFLFVIPLLFSAASASSQEIDADTFHEGFLITTTQDTIKGAIQYSLENNMVHVVEKGRILTYTSQNLFYFEIFDENVDSYRQFYSLPYKVKVGYEIPILFELQYEAPLSLITRQMYITETLPTSSFGDNISRLRLVYNFYFIDKKGNVKYFNGKKKDLYNIMIDKKKYIKEYIKENNLKVNNLKDLIRVTDFYNTI